MGLVDLWCRRARANVVTDDYLYTEYQPVRSTTAVRRALRSCEDPLQRVNRFDDPRWRGPLDVGRSTRRSRAPAGERATPGVLMAPV